MTERVERLLQIGGGDAALVERLHKRARRHVVADTIVRDPGRWPVGIVFHHLDGATVPGDPRFDVVVVDGEMADWHAEALRVLVPGGVLLEVEGSSLMEIEQKPGAHLTVIACYTEGTDYKREADLLRASLKAARMDYRIEGYPDGGDWYANTALKANFIRDMRDEMDGPLLYLDVDQYVHENCEEYFVDLVRKRVDFAAHWFAGPSKAKPWHTRADCCECVSGGACNRPHRMISSCLYLGDTDACRDLLHNWTALNALWRNNGITQGGGQKNLWYTITCMPDLKQTRLPGRYCYVFDKPWAYPDGEPCVIEHTISSREHRDRKVPEPNAKRRARIEQLRRGEAYNPNKYSQP